MQLDLAVEDAFDATGSLSDIHAGLSQNRLAFHTLIPTESGACVVVVAMDHETAAAVTVGASRYGASITTRTGQAEFIGVSGEGTRAEAQ